MIILDTHVLLWFEQGDRRLRLRAVRAIQRAFGARQVAVSTMTFWEVATHVREGDLTFIRDIDEWRRSLRMDGLIELPVTADIATQAGLLRNLHGDPADRIIVATALADGHELATADRRILAWTGPLRRLPAGR